jgi:hypothetical protein
LAAARRILHRNRSTLPLQVLADRANCREKKNQIAPASGSQRWPDPIGNNRKKRIVCRAWGQTSSVPERPPHVPWAPRSCLESISAARAFAWPRARLFLAGRPKVPRIAEVPGDFFFFSDPRQSSPVASPQTISVVERPASPRSWLLSVCCSEITGKEELELIFALYHRHSLWSSALLLPVVGFSFQLCCCAQDREQV